MKSSSHGSNDDHICFLTDSEDDNKDTKKTRKYIKWTKEEEDHLVRMKDEENKSWKEITASGQFHDSTTGQIQQVYKRLKAAQSSQIAYDDVFRMWNDKRAKAAILTIVKEEIMTRAETDLTITNAKLEPLLGQVICAKGKRA